jgi:hypothetical protein
MQELTEQIAAGDLVIDFGNQLIFTGVSNTSKTASQRNILAFSALSF